MSQFGFFDADRRLSVLSLKGDPLVEILALVPWEKFRTDIETVVLTAAGSKKSPAGRKPIDALVLFRMLVLQSLYNLSDEQIETDFRSHAFSGWALKTAFRTARRYGCSARSWRRLA